MAFDFEECWEKRVAPKVRERARGRVPAHSEVADHVQDVALKLMKRIATRPVGDCDELLALAMSAIQGAKIDRARRAKPAYRMAVDRIRAALRASPHVQRYQRPSTRGKKGGGMVVLFSPGRNEPGTATGRAAAFLTADTGSLHQMFPILSRVGSSTDMGSWAVACHSVLRWIGEPIGESEFIARTLEVAWVSQDLIEASFDAVGDRNEPSTPTVAGWDLLLSESLKEFGAWLFDRSLCPPAEHVFAVLLPLSRSFLLDRFQFGPVELVGLCGRQQTDGAEMRAIALWERLPLSDQAIADECNVGRDPDEKPLDVAAVSGRRMSALRSYGRYLVKKTSENVSEGGKESTVSSLEQS